MRLHRAYGLLSLAYMVGIFVLSEIPDRGGGAGPHALPKLLTNLGHVPLFAGLAWCVLMTLGGGRWRQSVPVRVYLLAVALSGTYAVFDEWHQSSVPGRSASVGDLLLDGVGILGLFLLHRLAADSPDALSKVPHKGS